MYKSLLRCEITNGSLSGFHNKNRVSTATERSHMQLSRFRVHFKRENFFRKRKQLTKSSAKLLPSTAIFSVSVGKRVDREVDRKNMLMRNGAIPLTISSEIALQVVRTSFRFHLRECMGSSFPPPPGLASLLFTCG